MIALISGTPGAGKTLNALKRFLIPHISKGRKIYTNIEGLNFLRLSINTKTPFETVEKNLIILEDSQVNFSTVDKFPLDCLVIIDEAQLFWNNREFKSEENKNILAHLQKHRHLGQDFVFITQHIDQLDIGIRRLTSIHYRLVKMEHIGFKNQIKVSIYPDALGSEQFAPAMVERWTIDPGLFRLYESYESDQTSEKTVRKINFFKNPKVIFAGFVTLICLVYAVNFFKNTGANIFASKMITSEIQKNKNEKENEINLKEQLYNSVDDFYCSNKYLYIFKNNKIDSLPNKLVPAGLCTKIGDTKM